MSADPEIFPPHFTLNHEAAFEVHDANTRQCWRIFADGRVEGFGGDAMIFNRITMLVRQAYAQGRAGQPLTAI